MGEALYPVPAEWAKTALADEAPIYVREAAEKPAPHAPITDARLADLASGYASPAALVAQALPGLLAFPSIASKRSVSRPPSMFTT